MNIDENPLCDNLQAFSDTKNLFRNRLKWRDEKNCLLNCNGIGQEFILNAQDNPSIVDWASYLLNNYGRD